jgi:uncharacterized protein (UPF0332 family)
MNKKILIDRYLPDLAVLFTFYRYSEKALLDEMVNKRIVSEEISAMFDFGKDLIIDPTANLEKFKKNLEADVPKKVVTNIGQGLAVLRRQLLEAAYSIFEKFLCHVLRVYLHTFPQLLKNIDRSIHFRDLVDFANNESIFEFMVESEIERFSRRSLQEKKDYFANRLKMKEAENSWIYEGEELWKDIDEKRQAIVHKEETPEISSEYLARAILYFQRAMIGISFKAQAYQGVPFYWQGFSDYIKKQENPKL